MFPACVSPDRKLERLNEDKHTEIFDAHSFCMRWMVPFMDWLREYMARRPEGDVSLPWSAKFSWGSISISLFSKSISHGCFISLRSSPEELFNAAPTGRIRSKSRMIFLLIARVRDLRSYLWLFQCKSMRRVQRESIEGIY
jgi:hypothetical protein